MPEVQEMRISAPAFGPSPVRISTGATDKGADMQGDAKDKRAINEEWSKLIRSVDEIQYAVPYLEEVANGEASTSNSDTHSSLTHDNEYSQNVSFHSAYSSEPTTLWSGDSEDAKEEEPDKGNGCNGKDVHEHHSHHVLEEPNCESATEAAEYGKVPFEDLTQPEKYSNEYFEVKKSRLGGIGAFAKRDLKQGELILVERPVIKATTWNFEEELDKLAPELQAAVGRMHGHKRSYDQKHPMAVFMTNSFGVQHGSCIYMIAARFNHACRPIRSVDYRMVHDDIIELKMIKDVAAGTELTISYGPQSPRSLYIMWGFRCSCGGCASITDGEVAKIDKAKYEEALRDLEYEAARSRW
ncbi:hypothetical protein GGR52DRAFT_569662 [Hypoxylon sp. FL1284]|nr:hypothetical protein GGR52DRAFT_569662 [Hypoxylon sp. FL1284]